MYRNATNRLHERLIKPDPSVLWQLRRISEKQLSSEFLIAHWDKAEEDTFPWESLSQQEGKAKNVLSS